MQTGVSDPKHIKLLEIIESNGGLGAGKAQAELRSAGIIVSEPTAGRALRDMEALGLLEKNGSSGRKLTSLGAKLLREHRAELEKINLTNDFAKSIKATEKAELLDILVARRAIEIELAKLAAPNITGEELDALRDTVSESKRLFERRESVSPQDTKFHLIIAAASRNKTLAAALGLIWHEGEYAKKLEAIRYSSKKAISEDHEEIVAALAEGDSKKAGERMGAHIDSVLISVKALPDDLVESGITAQL
ncbi:GntR family transcriptional regulator [Synergistales bacterium]|nr:GntR family transcriptional regulator [Synergistales bacterium]